jgi:hypothetical protein
MSGIARRAEKDIISDPTPPDKASQEKIDVVKGWLVKDCGYNDASGFLPERCIGKALWTTT